MHITYKIYKKLLILIILLSHNCYSKNIVYKIALVAPFSGAATAYGEELLAATNLAINNIKNNNVSLEIIPFDDQCNADLAKSVARSITKNKEIKAVIGHVCPATTKIASTIYAKHGLLHLIPTACATKVNEQPNITLFCLCGPDEKETHNISNFIYKNFSHKKIAILHSKMLFNQDLINYLQENLAILNIYPTLYQSISQDQFNNYIKLKAILKKLQKLSIDIIIFDGLYKEAANLIKAMHKNNSKIPIIVTSNVIIKKFAASLDNNVAAGTMVSFPNLTSQDNNKINLAIFGYTAIEIINYTLQHNSNYHPKILANWLHQNKVPTILGEKSWDTNGNIINDDFTMYLLDNNAEYILIN